MASISGLSGTTSSSLNSIRGYGGLSSGLDRDTLIENLTYGTTSKIEQQRLKKTSLQWKQDAYRNISSKMISFAEKYTSTYTSSTNLFSSSFWGRSTISAYGENSKYVSVSGTAKSESSFSVAGVKQLAQKAKWSSDAGVSDGTLKSGAIDPSKPIESEVLQGKSLKVEFGDKSYTVFLSGNFGEDGKGDAYKFDTQENIAAALNDLFSKEKLTATTDKAKTLADVMKATVKDGKLALEANDGKEGNLLKLTGGTALETLGLSAGEDGTEITKDAGITSSKTLGKADLIKETSFVDAIAGKKLTLSYNGVYKDIELPGADEFAGKSNAEIMSSIEQSMQDQLDSAFGKGRVMVETVGDDTSGYQLSFRASLPGGGDDKSSTLSVVSGDTGLMGANGALKMEYGESNRINLNAKLSEAGFSGLKDVTFPATIKINDAEIEVTEDDTMYTLMDKINSNEKAGVTISYESVSDRITMTANAEGASGAIKFGGDEKLLKGIFGQNVDVSKEIRGQDAIVAVKYGDSDEAVELVRGSNSFDIDGITVGLKETFGYKKDDNGNIVRDETTEDITFQAKADTEKIVNAVKDMVKEYNEILELVNKEVSTRPNRDYQPLTSEQKKELSEDDIKLYEEKAKEGLLFGDSDLRNLSNSLRFIINPTDLAEMEKIGITVSSEYSENGKLSVDETKLKAALESNLDNVKNLFTKKAGQSVNGVASSSSGIAENLKNVFDTYVRTTGATKGALIEKAGSVKAPTSVLTNALYKQMSEIDKTIARLQTRLTAEQDRYIKQFTSLENLISEMNNQSSWLSQFGG